MDRKDIGQGSDRHADVGRLCVAAFSRFKIDAFDNVAVGAIFGNGDLSAEDARWIGRHLMSNAGSLAAYKAGQEILVAIEAHRAD